MVQTPFNASYITPSLHLFRCGSTHFINPVWEAFDVFNEVAYFIRALCCLAV